ncbi:MAG: hypothetical protein JST87_07140 [Bacteroidetes bacterium]|nr:hypothetical protein [Bacteroidota bacterium]MBS1932709.1 hypothetical protein [Bacteroidota bacterium]
MKRINGPHYLLILAFFAACNNPSQEKPKEIQKDSSTMVTSYAHDREFMQKHTQHIIELQSADSNAKVLLSADFQGRVMTSSANGDSGKSFGWINYKLIESGEKKKQFNAFGGEERFWLGPEGGQYALYFKKGDSFNIAHWQVPAVIDTETYDVVSSDKSQATFSKRAALVNYSGTPFDILIERKISLIDKKQLEEKLHLSIPSSVQFVGYESYNSITNTGATDWKKENGLLSIWLLGMMTPSDQTKVIIPFLPQKNIHDYITDNYFGAIPADRLKIKDSVLFLTCDGKSRGKIGLSPLIAKSIAASYDFKNNVLSFILFPVDKNGMYVNSKWELQKQPFKGDVVNAYNDGPLKDGSQLGFFYEIESSSSVKELKKGEKQAYQQTTCHLQGNYEDLRAIAKQLLGVDLNDVR